GEGGLWRSTDSGASFTEIAGITDAKNVGFGKAAPGGTYMAIFTVATIDGVTGLYRSDDEGGSWVRINDDEHQWGNMGEALTGDPRIHGRGYLGTNGRGLIYGARTGPPVTVTPTVTPTDDPTSTPTVTPTVSPTVTPTTETGCTATYRAGNDWPDGFQAEVTVQNTGS